MKSILDYGAIGDGIHNCSPAIAQILENEKEIFFPKGIYKIEETIYIPSDRYIKLDDEAVIFAADKCFIHDGVLAIITNSDHINGNCNIIIKGGKIDANNIYNARADWQYGPNCGLTFSFKNVKNLTVKNLISHNSDSYNFHLCMVEDFVIENITFTSDNLTLCQDGIHVGGFCHRGVIKNIRAEYGCTNDDLVAFSADELHNYIHNTGLDDGPISDIVIEDMYAENCWSAIRILSVKSEIKNLTFKNITAGVRAHGINIDSSRYCEHPLFDDGEYKTGVGNLKNIIFENITLWYTGKEWEDEVLSGKREVPFKVNSFNLPEKVINIFETLGNISVKNLVREYSKDTCPDVPFIRLKHLYNTSVVMNEEKFNLNGEEKYCNEKEINIEIVKTADWE